MAVMTKYLLSKKILTADTILTYKKTGTITLTILDGKCTVDLEIVHNSISEGITVFGMTFFRSKSQESLLNCK